MRSQRCRGRRWSITACGKLGGVSRMLFDSIQRAVLERREGFWTYRDETVIRAGHLPAATTPRRHPILAAADGTVQMMAPPERTYPNERASEQLQRTMPRNPHECLISAVLTRGRRPDLKRWDIGPAPVGQHTLRILDICLEQWLRYKGVKSLSLSISSSIPVILPANQGSYFAIRGKASLRASASASHRC